MALDPRTASVACINGRVRPKQGHKALIYYWYDPSSDEPELDQAMRRAHPEIGDVEWTQLFAAAFNRGHARWLAENQPKERVKVRIKEHVKEHVVAYACHRRDSAAMKLALREARMEELSDAETLEVGRLAILVFQTRGGKSPGRRNVLRAVQTAATNAKLNAKGAQPIGLHDLRHSAAGLAFDSLALNEVSRLLRHANPRVTATV